MSTIFSKIINKEIPSYTIAENENFISFLDINPLTVGHFYQKSNNQTPKKSWKEYVISNPEKLI